MVPTPPSLINITNLTKISKCGKKFLIFLEIPRYLSILLKTIIMAVIKSYFKTTPIDEETLSRAIASAKDQENKIYQIFKKYQCMTSWDVYDVYNEMVSPILMSSVGRSMNTLLNLNVIYSLGTIPGENGRPVNLYQLNEELPEVIDRQTTQQIPKSIKIDLVINEEGAIEIEKMIEEMDLLLSRISTKFNLKY
jgi:predicted transcriptional regulator